MLQKHTEVATALQVFYYLGELATQVKGLLDAVHLQTTALVKRALDVRSLQTESAELPSAAGASTAATAASAGAVAGLGSNLLGSIRRVGEPPSGQSSLWATALWIRLDRLFDALVAAWQKVQRRTLRDASETPPVGGISVLTTPSLERSHAPERAPWLPAAAGVPTGTRAGAET